jgi:hypothetical protein
MPSGRGRSAGPVISGFTRIEPGVNLSANLKKDRYEKKYICRDGDRPGSGILAQHFIGAKRRPGHQSIGAARR